MSSYSSRKRRSISKDGQKPPTHPVVFLGDTLIYKWMEQGQDIWNHLYAPLNAGNHAAVNDSTLMLIEKLEKEEIPLDGTRTIVLMTGATDVRFRIKNVIILDQMRKIIQLLQQYCRGVKILVLGIMPRGDKDINPTIQEVNELLSQVENGFTVRWLDMWTHFVDPTSAKIINGLYDQDEVNLSSKGYQVWADVMAGTFEDCLMRD